MTEQVKKARQPRMVQTQTTLSNAISDAVSELDNLRDELQNWYDNMSENLQGGSKGDALQEAISALENCNNEPDVPECMEEIVVSYLSDRKQRSRADRCAECVGMLEAAVEVLNSMLEPSHKIAVANDELEIDEIMTEEQSTQSDEREQSIEQLRDEVQEIIDEAQNVEFPGMYG